MHEKRFNPMTESLRLQERMKFITDEITELATYIGLTHGGLIKSGMTRETPEGKLVKRLIEKLLDAEEAALSAEGKSVDGPNTFVLRAIMLARSIDGFLTASAKVNFVDQDMTLPDLLAYLKREANLPPTQE